MLVQIWYKCQFKLSISEIAVNCFFTLPLFVIMPPLKSAFLCTNALNYSFFFFLKTKNQIFLIQLFNVCTDDSAVYKQCAPTPGHPTLPLYKLNRIYIQIHGCQSSPPFWRYNIHPVCRKLQKYECSFSILGHCQWYRAAYWFQM